MLVRMLGLRSRTDRVASLGEVAEAMGTSRALLAKMMEDALRLGYLGTVDPDCGEARCEGCGKGAGCGQSSPARLWFLTEKGRRLLHQKG